MKKGDYIAFLFCVFFLSVHGQLVTNNTKSASSLVNDVLAGEGVQISNVTYKGAGKAIGEFFGASSNIGLNHGIILSTGTVLDELDNGKKNGPVGPNNNGSASSRNGTVGDSDVEGIVGKTTKDAAVLEFDFVPEGDTIKFRYVFASEEYPTQVGSGANDFFAFFISGVGISGKKNIALLPDNATEVSIETVNAGRNSNYYISNGTGGSGSQLTDPTVVNYNAFTTVLTAIYKVVPCKTYHLKIVITDVKDNIYDSGVFLEANSLNSIPKFEINQEADASPTGKVNEIFEACTQGEIKIDREQKLNESLVVEFAVSGSATEGVDFHPVGNSVTFAPNETSKKIIIKPISDFLDEGDETVILKFENPKICDANDSVAIEYVIKEQSSLVASTSVKNVTCPGDEITISPNVSQGVPEYQYNWDHGSVGAELTVKPMITTNYPYTATDFCGQQIRDSVQVIVPVYSTLGFVPMQDSTIRCRGSIINYTAQGLGGAGEYEYSWFSGEQTQSTSFTILENTTYGVTIKDKCGNEVIDEVEVLLDYPPFTATANPDTVLCYGDSILLTGVATGGVPPYRYSWEVTHPNPYWHVALQKRSLLFSAFDSCGIIPAEQTLVIDAQQPRASFEFNAPIPEPKESIRLLNSSSGGSTFYWEMGDGQTSREDQPEVSYDEVAAYQVTLYVFDDLMCSDTTDRVIQLQHPLYYYLPNSFSPNDDGINDVFIGKFVGVTDFSMTIFNRWGTKVFMTNDVSQGWDGMLSSGNKKAPYGVYVVKYEVRSQYREDKVYKVATTVTLVR